MPVLLYGTAPPSYVSGRAPFLATSNPTHPDAIVKAVADVPPAVRGQRPAGVPHSPWQLLEHMRIAQSDTVADSYAITLAEWRRRMLHAWPQIAAQA